MNGRGKSELKATCLKTANKDAQIPTTVILLLKDTPRSSLIHLLAKQKSQRFKEEAAKWARYLISREAGRGDGACSPSLGMALLLPPVVTRELESLLFLVDGGFLLAWHRILPPRDSEQKDNSAAHLNRGEESKTSAESPPAVCESPNQSPGRALLGRSPEGKAASAGALLDTEAQAHP